MHQLNVYIENRSITTCLLQEELRQHSGTPFNLWHPGECLTTNSPSHPDPFVAIVDFQDATVTRADFKLPTEETAITSWEEMCMLGCQESLCYTTAPTPTTWKKNQKKDCKQLNVPSDNRCRKKSEWLKICTYKWLQSPENQCYCNSGQKC